MKPSLLILCLFHRKVHPHAGHYNNVVQQHHLLANQLPALSAAQPMNIGVAHVVWPQTANKRNRHSYNRYNVFGGVVQATNHGRDTAHLHVCMSVQSV